MADHQPNWKMGELKYVEETQTVIYTDDVKAGDALKVTGVDDEGNYKVAKHTGTLKARFIAAYDGASGDMVKAIFRGWTKVTYGGAVGAGIGISFSANKAIAIVAANHAGHSVSVSAAADDLGQIYFDGGLQP